MVADVAVGVATGVVSAAFVYHSTILFAAPPVMVLFCVVRSIVAVPDPGVVSHNAGVTLLTVGDGLTVMVAVAAEKHKLIELITFA